MHLEGPWLTTTGKKKGKKKFQSAEHARKARQLAEEWEALKKKWNIDQTKKKKINSSTCETFQPSKPLYRGADEPRIPSLPFTAGVCAKAETKTYTGTLIKGIATMHKSNAVPIISDQEAVDISKMRR